MGAGHERDRIDGEDGRSATVMLSTGEAIALLLFFGLPVLAVIVVGVWQVAESISESHRWRHGWRK